MTQDIYIGFLFEAGMVDHGLTGHCIVGDRDKVFQEIETQVNALNNGEYTYEWFMEDEGGDFYPVGTYDNYGFFDWGRVWRITLNEWMRYSEFS